MILAFKGLPALLRSWHFALYTPVYGRTLRIVKSNAFHTLERDPACFLLGKYELDQLETVTIIEFRHAPSIASQGSESLSERFSTTGSGS